MDPTDHQTQRSQSFVIHLWLEGSALAEKPSTWRGHVTNVQTRERCAVDSLSGIAVVLAARLATAGFLLRWYESIWIRFMKATR